MKDSDISEKIDLLSIEMQLGKVTFLGSLTLLAVIASLMQLNPPEPFQRALIGIAVILCTILFLLLFYVGFMQIVGVEKKKNRYRKEILSSDIEENKED